MPSADPAPVPPFLQAPVGYSSQAGFVIAGLDPAIQSLITDAGAGNRVDTRAKPAHDAFNTGGAPGDPS